MIHRAYAAFAPRLATPLLLLVSLAATSVEAHGPTPAGIELLAQAGGAPTLLRLSVGAAWLDTSEPDDRWRYLCASAWGGPASPKMQAANDSLAFIARTDGLATLTVDGSVSAVPGSGELSATSVRSLRAVGGSVYAMTGFSGGSTIWRVATDGPPAAVYESPTSLGTMAADGARLRMATVRDGQLELLELDPATGTASPPRQLGAGVEGNPTLRLAGGTIYVRLQSSAYYRLFRVEPDDTLTEVAASDEPIYGPVVHAGRVLLTLDRHLAELQGDTPVELDSETWLTCLGVLDGLGAYVCDLPDIRRVTDDAQIGATLFRLASLTGPDFGPLDGATLEGCQLDWLDFSADAGFEVLLAGADDTSSARPGEDAGPPAPAPRSAEGCSCATSGGALPGSGGLLLLFVLFGALVRVAAPPR